MSTDEQGVQAVVWPSHVYILIFTFLDATSVVRSRRVSKAWNERVCWPYTWEALVDRDIVFTAASRSTFDESRRKLLQMTEAIATEIPRTICGSSDNSIKSPWAVEKYFFCDGYRYYAAAQMCSCLPHTAAALLHLHKSFSEASNDAPATTKEKLKQFGENCLQYSTVNAAAVVMGGLPASSNPAVTSGVQEELTMLSTSARAAFEEQLKQQQQQQGSGTADDGDDRDDDHDKKSKKKPVVALSDHLFDKVPLQRLKIDNFDDFIAVQEAPAQPVGPGRVRRRRGRRAQSRLPLFPDDKDLCFNEMHPEELLQIRQLIEPANRIFGYEAEEADQEEGAAAAAAAVPAAAYPRPPPLPPTGPVVGKRSKATYSVPDTAVMSMLVLAGPLFSDRTLDDKNDIFSVEIVREKRFSRLLNSLARSVVDDQHQYAVLLGSCSLVLRILPLAPVLYSLLEWILSWPPLSMIPFMWRLLLPPATRMLLLHEQRWPWPTLNGSWSVATNSAPQPVADHMFGYNMSADEFWNSTVTTLASSAQESSMLLWLPRLFIVDLPVLFFHVVSAACCFCKWALLMLLHGLGYSMHSDLGDAAPMIFPDFPWIPMIASVALVVLLQRKLKDLQAESPFPPTPRPDPLLRSPTRDLLIMLVAGPLIAGCIINGSVVPLCFLDSVLTNYVDLSFFGGDAEKCTVVAGSLIHTATLVLMWIGGLAQFEDAIRVADALVPSKYLRSYVTLGSVLPHLAELSFIVSRRIASHDETALAAQRNSVDVRTEISRRWQRLVWLQYLVISAVFMFLVLFRFQYEAICYGYVVAMLLTHLERQHLAELQQQQ